MNVVPSPPGVKCSASRPLTKWCPFKNEPDEGVVKVEWTTEHFTLELHDLNEYLDSWTDTAISHEDFVIQARADLEAAGVWCRVTWAGVTAGLCVVASTGPGCDLDALLRESVHAEGA